MLGYMILSGKTVSPTPQPSSQKVNYFSRF